MDAIFSRKLSLFLLCLALSACGEDSRIGDILKKPSTSCEETAISHRYVAKWKDGRTSFYNHKTREEIIDEVVLPNLEELKFVENDYVVNFTTFKNITESNSLWAHERIGSQSAWDQGLLGNGVKVAVIDTGIDVNQLQLQNQLLLNTNEIPNNGIDDDKNGLIDDYYGYDFFNDRAEITDYDGHGTHVAGIIAAEHLEHSSVPPSERPKIIVKGLAPNAKILPIKFMEFGGGMMSSAALAIYYAISRDVDVINASWGGPGCSTLVSDAIAEANKAGIIVVTAAGNDGLDVDVDQIFPGVHKHPNIINVAAIGYRGMLTGFSNYGIESVDIAAPGLQITSTLPNNTYGSWDGTSMAAPFITASIALLKQQTPQLGHLDLIHLLLQSSAGNILRLSTRGELNINNFLVNSANLTKK